jgi:hypothetical protein
MQNPADFANLTLNYLLPLNLYWPAHERSSNSATKTLRHQDYRLSKTNLALIIFPMVEDYKMQNSCP